MSTNNMKSFDPTKPCQTRDGRKVRILCTDANICSGETIIALVTNQDGTQAAETRWFPNGTYYYEDSFRPDRIDLINTPSEPRYRPWTAEEVPVGALLRCKTAGWVALIAMSASGRIRGVDGIDLGLDFIVTHHEYTTDIFKPANEKNWLPCGVQITEDAQ